MLRAQYRHPNFPLTTAKLWADTSKVIRQHRWRFLAAARVQWRWRRVAKEGRSDLRDERGEERAIYWGSARPTAKPRAPVIPLAWITWRGVRPDGHTRESVKLLRPKVDYFLHADDKWDPRDIGTSGAGVVAVFSGPASQRAEREGGRPVAPHVGCNTLIFFRSRKILQRFFWIKIYFLTFYKCVF
jgi:hypothetical protein